MTELTRKIQSAVQSGRAVRALVVDVFYGKASVRLAGNGALMRNLSVIGGPVTVGQVVNVDFTTPDPTIVAISQEQIDLNDVKTLFDSLDNPGQSNLFSWEIITFANGSIVNTYTADTAGLTDACSDLSEGIIYVPAVDITGDFTVQGQAALVGMDRERTIINGTITAQGGVSCLSIIKDVNSANDETALAANPTTIPVSYRDLYIYCTQAGSGTATGMLVEGSREIRVANCHIIGEHTAAGTAYGVKSTMSLVADAHFFGGRIDGTTAPYLVT